MEAQNNINMERPLCAKGCGYFGSVQSMNLCSKCYKEFLKEERLSANSAAMAAKASTILEKPVPADASNSSTNAGVSLDSNDSKSSDSVKKRCESCNKRVGPTGFNCRCGGLFCAKHRYPEEHSCCVDFKKAGREVLAKQNPLCKGDKLQWRI